MKLRLKRLDRQTLVIMGATSGVGLVLARRAAHAGARVFLIARDRRQLERLTEEITESGGNADFAVADVGIESEVQAAGRAAITRFGEIDTWVNTAGVAVYAPLLEITREDHEHLFRTNYWGVVHGCLTAVGYLKQSGGALITVGSVVCDMGTPILGAYTASKHAVKGYIDSLRIELLADKAPVAVTLIKPSGVGTPLAEHARNYFPNAGRIPPPAYDPDLVVDAILHSAQHVRREFSVGGIGALQILGFQLFPGTSDWLASKLPPLMTDSKRAAPTVDNLREPVGNGGERTSFQTIRKTSLYTTAVLNPGITVCVLAALALAALALVAPLQKGRRLLPPEESA